MGIRGNLKVDIFEKMHSGKIYDPGDADVLDKQMGYQELLYDYNMTRPGGGMKRQTLLKKMFADIGENCYIEPPLHANMGAHHVHFGENICGRLYDVRAECNACDGRTSDLAGASAEGTAVQHADSYRK